MKKFKILLALATVVLFAAAGSRGEARTGAAPSDGRGQALSWRVIPADARFPTKDVIMAICQLTDERFNLPADPIRNDCTAAFQAAIDFASAAGGGTVFIPEGQYRLDGPLTLPQGVLLQGRWSPPTDPDYRNKTGTVIRLENDRIDPDDVVIKEKGGQIKDLTFWHPKQDPAKGVTRYPWIMKMGGGNSIVNVTFLNAYRGFQISASNADVKNIYGCAYDIGLDLLPNYAIPRLQNHQFSSEYLGFSGLEKDPARLEAHRKAVYATGVASQAQRLHATKYVDGHKIGFRVYRDDRMSKESQASLNRAVIRNCQIGIHIDVPSSRNNHISNTLLENCRVAVQFSTGGGRFLVKNSNITGSMTADIVAGGPPVDVDIENSMLNLSKLKLNGGKVTGTPSAVPVKLGAQPSAEPEDGAGAEASEEEAEEAELDFDPATIIYRNPSKLVLFNVKDPRFAGGAKGDGVHDDTAAVEAAIQAANNNGGGFVLFPGGHYRITRNLKVGRGIQLRGSDSGLSSATGPTTGSSLRIEVPPVSSDEVGAEAFITLGDDSGVRGLAFYYPNQNAGGLSGAFKKYPYTLRGNGVRNYVMFCRPINPYRFVHFNGDDNLIAYNQLAGIRQVIYSTNSKNGLFEHNLTKPTNWYKSGFPFPGKVSKDAYKGFVINEGFEILHLKDCEDYHAEHLGSYAHGGFRGATIENSSVTGTLSLEQYLTGWEVRSGNKPINIRNKVSTTNRDGPAGASTETFGMKLCEDFTGHVTVFNGTIHGSFGHVVNVQGGSYHRTGGAVTAGLCAVHVGEKGSVFFEGIPFKGGVAIKSEGAFKMRDCHLNGGVFHPYARQLGADNTFASTFVATRLARRSLESYGLVLDRTGLEFKGDGLPKNSGFSTSAVSLTSTQGRFDFKVEYPDFLNQSPHAVTFEMGGRVPEGTELDLWYYSKSGWTKLEKTRKSFKGKSDRFIFNINNTAFGKQKPGEHVPDIRLTFKGQSPKATSFTLSTEVYEPFAPKSPTGLTVQSAGGIVLDWDDNAEKDVTYNVYRRPSSSGAFGKPLATRLGNSSYTDKTAAPGSNNWYVVTAVDAEGRESCISEAVGPANNTITHSSS